MISGSPQSIAIEILLHNIIRTKIGSVICITFWIQFVNRLSFRRRKARSYQVNRANPAASQPNLVSDDMLSVKDKQRIMAALLFLICALPSAPEVT